MKYLSLQNGVSGEDRKLNIEFPWPQPDIPMMFYVATGKKWLLKQDIPLMFYVATGKEWLGQARYFHDILRSNRQENG